MTLSLIRSAAVFAVMASGAAAHGDVSYGPQVVTIDVARTWRDGAGGTLASDSISTGTLQFGPNTGGPVLVPEISFPVGSLPSSGQPDWVMQAWARTTAIQSGNSSFMSSSSHAVCITLGQNPAIGAAEVSFAVTHSVDFQLDQATPWQARLFTVLTSPLYPSLRVIRDPLTTPVTVFGEQLLASNGAMRVDVGGVLAPGSYRLVMEIPLVNTFPGSGAGVHSGGVNFIVPAPASGAVLGAAALVGARRRRRA